MKLKVYILLLCLLFPLLYGTPAYTASPGSTCLNFLKIGVGARAIGMGEAFVAVSDDASAFYWNPSGLSQLERGEILGMYVNWPGGMDFGFASGALPVRKSGVFGISVVSLSRNDIPGYDDGGTVTGNVGVSDTAVTLTYAHKLTLNREKGRTFHAGASVKYIGEQLSNNTAIVYAVDAGVLFNFSRDRFNIGFSAQNIGGKQQYLSTAYPLPSNYRLGFASRVLGDDLLVAVDFNLPNDNRIFMNAGFEFRINNLFALRAGYKFKPVNDDLDEGLRCGLGFLSEIVDVDYSYAPYGYLGDAHRFSLSYRFGGAFEKNLIFEKIDNYFLKGKRYYRKKDYVRANKTFNDVLVLDPDHKEAKEYLGMISSTVKDIKVETYLEKGKNLLEDDKLLKSKEEFENILSLFPGHPQAKAYLEKLKDKIVVEKQKMADIMFSDGLEYYKKKQYEEAIVLWRKIRTIKPEHKDSMDFIAMAEAKLDEIKKEKEIEVLARKYRDADILYEKGLKLYERQRYDRALKTIEEVLELNPGHEKAGELIKKVSRKLSAQYCAEGEELLEEGSVEEALEKLEAASKLNPGNEQAAESRKKAGEELRVINREKADGINKEALLKYSDGRIVEAIELWKKALELCPGHVNVRKNMIRAQEEKDKQ